MLYARLFAFFGLAFIIASCSTTTPFTLKSVPPGRTREQVQLDNLECSKLSEEHGPWVFGIGTAIMQSDSAKKYEDCMSARGYVVQRTDGAGSKAHSSPAPQAPKAAQTTVPPEQKTATPVPTRAPAAAAASTSTADRLKKLDELYSSGLITKDEYDRKRQEILSSL